VEKYYGAARFVIVKANRETAHHNGDCVVAFLIGKLTELG
jgi:hypothetical protein